MDRSDDDDRELIRLYCRGDATAFEAFYRRHRDGIYGFLRFTAKDEFLAADLTQKVFLRLIEKARSLAWSSTDHPKRWLYRVAVNAWLDESRRLRRVRRDDGTDVERLPDRRADRMDGLNEAVRRAVESLPEKIRAVAGLRYFGGLSYKETARTLRLPIGTVRSRLARATELLSLKLKDWKKEI